MSSIEETKGIRAVMILEVMGRPPEHLNETLDNLIKRIDEEKGVSVKAKKISEPKEMEKQKGFYTSFAEIEIEVEEILFLAVLIFKFMPAHIEIIYPELIALTNNGWNDVLNELTRRLHGYDEVARILQLERGVLERRLREGIKEENKKPVKKKASKRKSKKK